MPLRLIHVPFGSLYTVTIVTWYMLIYSIALHTGTAYPVHRDGGDRERNRDRERDAHGYTDRDRDGGGGRDGGRVRYSGRVLDSGRGQDRDSSDQPSRRRSMEAEPSHRGRGDSSRDGRRGGDGAAKPRDEGRPAADGTAAQGQGVQYGLNLNDHQGGDRRSAARGLPCRITRLAAC